MGEKYFDYPGRVNIVDHLSLIRSETVTSFEMSDELKKEILSLFSFYQDKLGRSAGIPVTFLNTDPILTLTPSRTLIRKTKLK